MGRQYIISISDETFSKIRKEIWEAQDQPASQLYLATDKGDYEAEYQIIKGFLERFINDYFESHAIPIEAIMRNQQKPIDLDCAIENLAFAIARNGGKQADHVEIIIADKLKALAEAILREVKGNQ